MTWSDYFTLARIAAAVARNPLGFLLVYLLGGSVFLSIVTAAALPKSNPATSQIIVYADIAFLPSVLIAFVWLTTRHHGKLYGPHDFRQESHFIGLARGATAATQTQTSSDDFEVDIEDAPEPVKRATSSPHRARLHGLIIRAMVRVADEVQGDDFRMVVNSTSANATRPVPGFHLAKDDEIYYVPERRGIFLVHSLRGGAQMTSVVALPTDAVLISGGGGESVFRMLADVVRGLERSKPVETTMENQSTDERRAV